MRYLNHPFCEPDDTVVVESVTSWRSSADVPRPLRIPIAIDTEFPELADRYRYAPPRPVTSNRGGAAPEPGGYPGELRYAEEFARVTGEHGRNVIAELIDEYWLWWQTQFSSTFIARHPDLFAELEQSWKKGNLTRSTRAYNAAVYAATAAQVLLWGGWEPSRTLVCVLCSRHYDAECGYYGHVRRGIDYRFCHYCCGGVFPGADERALEYFAQLSDDQLADRLQRFSTTVGSIPPADLWSQPWLHGFEYSHKVRVVAGLLVTPPPKLYFERFGRPWTRVLMKTRVLKEGRVTARGTMSLASDGHMCRSVGERVIDDFLTANGISHDVEPNWPVHPEYNASGNHRADWVFDDGTYVEYAGMTGDPTYDAKMVRKVAMAADLGINLEVIFPSDLRDLRRRFASYLIDPVASSDT